MKINSSLTPLGAGNERFRREVEEALGRRVAPQKRGRRKGVDGIEGEQTALDFEQR